MQAEQQVLSSEYRAGFWTARQAEIMEDPMDDPGPEEGLDV